MKLVCAAVLCGLWGAILPAQGPDFKAGVDLVTVVATVVDGRGLIVPGLQAGAFSIEEDGKPRPISSFATSGVPLSLVLALDASKSMDGDGFRFASEAVQVFADQLRPGDKLAIVGFNKVPFLIAPWTSDPATIASALQNVHVDGTTALYEGVSMALDISESGGNKKRAIVVVSDGSDFHGTTPMMFSSTSGQDPGITPANWRAMRARPVLAKIRATEALLYGIGINAPASTAVARNYDPASQFDAATLATLSEPSGGFVQVVTSAASVPAAARRIREQLDHQYVLGFVPEHLADNKFHRLRVSVRGCKCSARARSGFVARRPPAER